MAKHIAEDFGLFVVADGLGGHFGGEKAAEFFCRGVLQVLFKFQPLLADHDPKKVVRQWLQEAIDIMRIQFADDPHAPHAHTTCAMLFIDPKQVITAHCGDSRIYRLNREEVVWRTSDHSMPQELFNKGQITEQEIGSHPLQNHLTRSVNILNEHEVEINVFPAINTSETFVICSDGFWSHIKEAELVGLAQPSTDHEMLKKIAKLMMFRAHGRSDNLTVQLVRRQR